MPPPTTDFKLMLQCVQVVTAKVYREANKSDVKGPAGKLCTVIPHSMLTY